MSDEKVFRLIDAESILLFDKDEPFNVLLKVESIDDDTIQFGLVMPIDVFVQGVSIDGVTTELSVKSYPSQIPSVIYNINFETEGGRWDDDEREMTVRVGSLGLELTLRKGDLDDVDEEENPKEFEKLEDEYFASVQVVFNKDNFQGDVQIEVGQAYERSIVVQNRGGYTATIGDISLLIEYLFICDGDCVFGCLDNREARLWVNRCCWKTSTPWIDGGIQVISGVVSTFTPPDSACYECKMSEMDYKLINMKYSCPLLKREDIVQGKVPTAPTVASIAGALQVQEMLKVIHGIPVNGGAALMMSGETNSFYTSRFQRRDDCLSHETYPEPTSLDLGHLTPLGEYFAAVRRTLPDGGGDEPLTLHLERDVLRELFCPQCDYRKEIWRPLTSVSLHEGTCPTCDEVCQTDIIHTVTEADAHLQEQSLASLGVPKYEILKVQSHDGTRFHLLAADRTAAFGAAL